MEERNVPCQDREYPREAPLMGIDSQAPMVENKIRETRIQQLNSGYLVNVGCHSFAFSTKEELVTKLMQYINAPAETERKWFSGELF